MSYAQTPAAYSGFRTPRTPQAGLTRRRSFSGRGTNYQYSPQNQAAGLDYPRYPYSSGGDTGAYDEYTGYGDVSR